MALVLSARDSKQQPKVGTSGALEIDGKRAQKGHKFMPFLHPLCFPPTKNSSGMYGGYDGARTRDLYRDRA